MSTADFPIDTSTIFESDYTMTAWFKADDTGREGFFFGQAGGNNGVHHGVRGGAALHTAHWGSDFSANTALQPGVWYHAAFTYKYNGPRDALGEARIYLNGVLDSAVHPQKAINEAGSEFQVGARANGDTGNDFDGDIDEVAVWNVALTDNQIAFLAAGGSPIIPEPSTIVLAAVGLLGLAGFAVRRRRRA